MGWRTQQIGYAGKIKNRRDFERAIPRSLEALKP